MQKISRQLSASFSDYSSSLIVRNESSKKYPLMSWPEFLRREMPQSKPKEAFLANMYPKASSTKIYREVGNRNPSLTYLKSPITLVWKLLSERITKASCNNTLTVWIN